ncbi:MAG: MFS transporter [Candidatus Altiarchaeota archaeon]
MHLLRHGHLLHRKLVVILVATLLWWMADFAVEFAFPTYLEGAGKSYLEIGLFISIAAAAGLLIDLPLGSLSDRVSKRRLMIAGLLIAVVSASLIFHFRQNAPLYLFFFVWGLAFQIWRVPRDAYFASHTDKLDRSQEYGLDMEVKYLGQSIGPLLAGFLLASAGFSGIIGFYGFILVLAACVLFFFLEETNHRPMKTALDTCVKEPFLKRSVNEVRSMGGSGVILLYFTLLFTAWEQTLLTFQPLFSGPDGLGLSPELGGLVMASFSILGIVLSFPAGKLADRFGKRPVLTAGLLVMGMSLVMFSFSADLIHAVVFALLTSLGWALSMPALFGLIIDLAEGHKKGCVAGVWDLFMDLGFVAGPLFGGFICQFYGIKNAFLFMGFVFLASTLILHLDRNGSGRKRLSR